MGGSIVSFRFLLGRTCVSNPVSALKALTKTDPAVAGRCVSRREARGAPRCHNRFSGTSHLRGRA
jgi:hypothetical protein